MHTHLIKVRFLSLFQQKVYLFTFKRYYFINIFWCMWVYSKVTYEETL